MSISRNKILEQRKKLQEQKEKDEVKLKTLQLKLRKSSQQIAQIKKQEESEKKMILGSLILEKAKADASLQKWLKEEIVGSDLSDSEKGLFENFN